jgi:DNA-binding transcriptional MerR regulator
MSVRLPAADHAGDFSMPGEPVSAGAKSRAHKAPSAFRTISEVAEDLHIPQHVLRFWEGKFTQVRPLKRGGGRRYYRPEDIALLRRISALLYVQGYTIKGVQRLLREGGGQLSDDIPPPAPEEKAVQERFDLLDSVEPQLPMPGLTPLPPPQAKPQSARPLPPRRTAREVPDITSAELIRLRRLLRATLAELEALRGLLP